ncbi:unnamed protein product [Schistosoma turkestanicum]|nr:unnamed protein product [Schistosoma turkestanicum]
MMKQNLLRNSNYNFQLKRIYFMLIIIMITVIIIPNETFSMTLYSHSQKPNNFIHDIDYNNMDDDYQHYLSQQHHQQLQSSNLYPFDLFNYLHSISTQKRAPAPSAASSFRNSPSFSFNGDMRLISNLRHMMSGANPLTAFG